jgi:transaldolase
MADRLAELSAAGVAVWLDDISRGRLSTGNLDQLRRDNHVVGVTSNPTIFAKAVSDSDDYAEQLADLAKREIGVEESGRMLTTYDVRWACDVMRPAYDASSGVDGRVSIEVDPRVAHDTEKTVAEAKALWWLVDRPNLFIKIPATAAGVPAIARTLALGISVNVTLIFGLDRYNEVMDAFFEGMEQARANGHDITGMASVASFFVSRVDTEVDKRLEKIGSDEAKALRGKAAIANAQLAYQRYEKAFATPRWQALAAAGARPQRPLWASTSTKNPDYRDVMYVEELIAPGRGEHHARGDHPRLRRPRRGQGRGGAVLVRSGAAGPGPTGRVRHRVRRRHRHARTGGRGEVHRILAGTGDECREQPEGLSMGEVEGAAGLAVRGADAVPGAAEARQELTDHSVAGLLFEKDPTLWGKDAEAEAEIRLGWVDTFRRSRDLLPRLRELRRAAGRAGPRGAGRNGRLVARARGHRPHVGCAVDRAGHHRPAPGTGRAGRPARPHGRRGLQQVGLHCGDRLPPPGRTCRRSSTPASRTRATGSSS